MLDSQVDPLESEKLGVDVVLSKESTIPLFGNAQSWIDSCWLTRTDFTIQLVPDAEVRNDADDECSEGAPDKGGYLLGGCPSGLAKTDNDDLYDRDRVSAKTFGKAALAFLPRQDKKNASDHRVSTIGSDSRLDYQQPDQDGSKKVGNLEKSDSFSYQNDGSKTDRNGRSRINSLVSESMSRPLRQIKRALSNKEAKVSSLEVQRNEYIANLEAAIRSNGRYDVKVADILTEMAEFYQNISMHKQAQSLLSKALAIYSAKLGDYNLRCIDVRIRIARLHHLQNELEEAMEKLCYAIEMMIALLGASHSSVLEVRSLLSEVLRKKGKVKEAVKESKRVLRGYRDAYGDEHPIVCATVENIADLYFEMGDHQRANGILAEVVKLRIAIDGQCHVSVADAMMSWARSFDAMEDSTKALKLMKQSHNIYLEKEGESSPSLLKTLHAMGKIYGKLGDHEKAVKAYTRVLTVKKQTLGINTPETAASYVTVGRALRDMGEIERAAKCMKRASEIFDKIDSKSITADEEVLDSLHQLGAALDLAGDYDASLKAFNRELNIRKKEGGLQQMRAVADVLNCMGLVNSKKGSSKYAMNCFVKSLSVRDTLDGRNSELAETLANAGHELEKMRYVNDARQAYFEAVLIFKASGNEKGTVAVDELLKKLGLSADSKELLDANGQELRCSLLDRKTSV